MRLAIISDIHGNLPALEAVMAEIAAAEPDETWNLGDVVGYGADPDDCVRLVAERCARNLIGNHDLAVIGELDVESFSPTAAAAVEWTRANADPGTLEFLRGLEPAREEGEVSLYHGSPRDPVWEYVLWPDQAAECLTAQATRVSLVGHSHVALFFTRAAPGDVAGGPTQGTVALEEDGTSEGTPEGAAAAPGAGKVRGAQAGAGTMLELQDGRWLVNPGSIGQPRDGDPRAAWLELDTGNWTASYHRVAYDIDRAAAAIAERGLPDHLGRRLYAGQ